jgi:hypothetical protein
LRKKLSGNEWEIPTVKRMREKGKRGKEGRERIEKTRKAGSG